MANDLNRLFSKEIQVVKKYMKKCSISLLIRELHIKSTILLSYTLVRVAIIKPKTITRTEQKQK
jgi:hypothetical protein